MADDGRGGNIPKAAQVMESDQSVSHTDDTPLLDSNIFWGGPPNNRSNRNAISNYFSIQCGFFVVRHHSFYYI